MRMLTITILTCLALTATAQQFQLRTADGELTGPFDLREGTTVTIGTTEATIVDVKSRSDQVLDAMESIVIPEMDFRNAAIQDVVQFMQQASIEFDRQKRGVSFILNLAAGSTNAPADPFDAAPAEPAVTSTVTFSARQITLLETLKIVTQIAGLKYRIVGGVVMIIPWNAPEGEIVYRMYEVLPTVCEKVSSVNEALGHAQQDSDADLKQFFGDMGVSWPVGSSIKYIPAIGKLVVANTQANLDVFERILGQLRVQPFQIEMEVTFVAFDLAKIAKLEPGGITAESLTTLWTNGEAEVLATPRVLTQSGMEATSKGVTECIYPTEFAVLSSTTNTNTVVVSSVVEPGGFETREVGVILSALPEVSPDGNMINVTLSPELVEDPIWEEYGSTFTDAKGVEQQAHMPQPFFHTYSACTSVSVANGHTVLISGGMPTRDRKRVVYAFLTARMVGIRGEPIRTEIDVEQSVAPYR